MSQQPVTDFTQDEVLTPTQIPTRGAVCKQTLPIWLPERRLYLFVDLKQPTPGDFDFDGTVVLLRSGKPIAELPARVASMSGTPQKSRATIFNAGGSPVGDSLVLSLAQPFDAAIKSVVLQPTRINCEADAMYLRVNRFDPTNITGFRAYLACLSTRV